MKKENYLSPELQEFKVTTDKMLCQSPDFVGYLEEYDVTESIGEEEFID